ncbi:MAG TPA: hypothetical protein VF265_10840, partial [Nevskiaceae bacterium]
ADVGIAIGTATDVAVSRAAITLTGDTLALEAILRARKLSRSTVRNIRQNLAFASVYNLIGIPVAAGALYPFCGFLLSPMLAVLAMSLASIAVITHALGLPRTRRSGAPAGLANAGR